MEVTQHLFSTEQFEDTFMAFHKENRKIRWKKFLQQNEPMAHEFKKTLKTQDNDFVLSQVVSLYRSLSERIHNANHTARIVEWQLEDFGVGWSKVLDFMCMSIFVRCKIIAKDEKAKIIEDFDIKKVKY